MGNVTLAMQHVEVLCYNGLNYYKQVCLYGNAMVLLEKSILFVYFLNKIYLPCCCVVFVAICQLHRLIQLDFGDVSFSTFSLLKERQGCTLISGVPAAQVNKYTENNLADLINDMLKLHVCTLVTHYPQCFC